MNLQYWSLERATGFVLVLGNVVLLPGLMMFWIRWIRSGHRDAAPPNAAYFVWERSFLMAAVVLTAIGLVLLEGHLQNTDGRVLARTGATAYLFAGILLVASEALNLKPGQNTYALMAIYVVLAFLAQAAIGGSLLQSGLLSAWIGWGTIIWNVAWLVVLPVTSPRDIYYPILHHLMPLLIGIALLLGTP